MKRFGEFSDHLKSNVKRTSVGNLPQCIEAPALVLHIDHPVLDT